MNHSRPIPGSSPHKLYSGQTMSNGNCPVCDSPVLWATNRQEGHDESMWFSPLDPEVLDPAYSELVWVLVSSTGEASAITPVQHRKHVCSPIAVEEMLARIGGMGFYTAEVLATPCPVRPCGAAPGMLCLTGRREALGKPHGARVVTSRGESFDIF